MTIYPATDSFTYYDTVTLRLTGTFFKKPTVNEPKPKSSRKILYTTQVNLNQISGFSKDLILQKLNLDIWDIAFSASGLPYISSLSFSDGKIDYIS